MDDEALRRLAIAEIVHEINEAKRKENPTSQPAINPLFRANKTFLGRTINSVLQHNKRQHIREKKNSSKKLYELERQSKKTSKYCQSEGRNINIVSCSDKSQQSDNVCSSHHKSSTVHRRKSRKRSKRKGEEKKVRKSRSASNESYRKHRQRRTSPYFVESLHEIESQQNNFHSEYVLQYDNSEVSSAYTQMSSYYAAMINLSECFDVCNATSRGTNFKSCEKPVMTIDLTKNKKTNRKKEKRKEKRRKRSKSHISIDSSSESCNKSVLTSFVDSSSECSSI